MLLELSRFGCTPYGTFGRLFVPDRNFSCYTIEPEWNDNVPSVSCIPDGVYRLTLDTYHRGGYPAYMLLEIPDRYLIKMHRANKANELLGCIATGRNLGYVGGMWAITESRTTYKHFMEAMAGLRSAKLQIKWEIGGRRFTHRPLTGG